MNLSLYVITDRTCQGKRSMEETAEEVIRGGATVLQYREKAPLSTRILCEEVIQLRRITMQHRVLFFVNDRVDLALACGADGVHLGDEDLPVPIARRIAPDLLIGASCDSVESALRAQEEGADYLGVGPVYVTATKPDAGEAVGTGLLAEVKNAVTIPVVAIGGITPENVPEVLQSGVDGVAVIQAVVGSPSPRSQAARFRKLLNTKSLCTSLPRNKEKHL